MLKGYQILENYEKIEGGIGDELEYIKIGINF
jgi:hypothetical protein